MNNKIQMYENILIRPFKRENDDIEELTRVLNRAYKELDDMGFKYHATYQDSDVTRQRIDGAYCLVGIHNDKIIATITYYKPGIKSGSEWYEKEDVGVVGQFGVLPGYRSIGLGAYMMDMVEAAAHSEGTAEIALDTAEGAQHLRSYYRRRGYRFIGYVDWEMTNYESVIMSKNLNGLSLKTDS